MYIEPWYSDTLVVREESYLVRVPIYGTCDIYDESDSIGCFVIPLCFWRANETKYCSVTDSWNNTDLYPYPAIDRSLFRHIMQGEDVLVHN